MKETMNTAARLPRTLIALIALAGALVATLWVSTARSEAARATCPGSFTVEHNDVIGKLQLPAGKYKITLIDDQKITCPRATARFQQFLYDYDGRLPSPWVYKVIGVGDGKFFHKTDRQIGFRVQQGSSPGPTPTPGKYQRCPGTFRVLNNDRIGALVLPKGNYFIYRSTNPALGCKYASDLFRKFLNYPSGILPAPWKLNAAKATFTNTQKGYGFRVKQAS